MPEIFVLANFVDKFVSDALLAQQKVGLIFIFDLRVQMLVVEPVFTFIALKHEFVDKFRVMRVVTIAIAIKEIFAIVVFFVLVVFLVRIQLACERGPTVATVASEVHSRV